MNIKSGSRLDAYAKRDEHASIEISEKCGPWARIIFFSLVFSAVSPVVPIYGKAIVFAIFSIPMILSIKRIKRGKIFLLFIMSLFFIYSISKDYYSILSITNSTTLSLYYIPFCVFVGFLVSCYYNMNNFLEMLESMMFWMALVSLILFAFFMTFPELVYRLPVYVFEESEHRTIGFLNILFSDNFLMKRNSGFASEPGVFQMLLNLSLYQNLRKGRSFNIRNVVYVSSILTGLSTSGLIIMSVLIVAFSSKSARLGVAIICITGGAFVQTIVKDQVENKFYGSYAFSQRYVPFTNALDVIADNPDGIGSVEYSARLKRSDIGSFDAYTQTAMRYGIQGLVVLIASLLILFFSAPGFSLILAISYISNSFWYIPIFSCFLFWGVGKTRLTRSGS